jgi:hypothetical protein
MLSKNNNAEIHKNVHVTVTNLRKVQDEMYGDFLNTAADQYI